MNSTGKLTEADIPSTLKDLPAEASDELFVDALLDAEAYQCCFQEALHALAVVVKEYDLLEQRYHRLLDERRAR